MQVHNKQFLSRSEAVSKAAGWSGLVAAIVGVVVEIGWLLDVSILTSVGAGFATMKFNTALGFILSGISLWLLKTKSSPSKPSPMIWVLCGASLVLAFLSMLEYSTGFNLGVDEALVSDSYTDPALAPPGRMSWATAQCFFTVNIALLIAAGNKKKLCYLGDFFALVTFFSGITGICGYLFNVDALYWFFPYSSMAIHTSVLFVLVSAGVLFIHPQQGVALAIASTHVGGQLARRILPLILILPILMAWLRIRAQQAGLINPEMGIALAVVVSIAIFGTVVWFSSHSLNRMHQKLLEQATALKQQAAIVDSSHQAIVAKTKEGVITSWNGAAEKLFGFKEAEMLGHSMSELIRPEDADEESRILDKVIRGESAGQWETRRKHKDGRLIDVSVTISPIEDSQGQIVGVSNISTDISERRKLDAQLKTALRQSQEFKAALDEHAIVAITDPSGKITYVNEKFCDISKYSREELLGQDHRIVNSGFHSKEFIKDLWSTIAGGQVWSGEIRNRAKDGSVYWVETTIVPFLNDQGKPRQYMAVRADITEIKEAQEELARSNQELERFAYVASHDLQEPLRAVAGCLDILKRNYADQLDAKAGELIHHSVDGSYRMKQLIDDLLTFSRVESRGKDFKLVDCSKVIEIALKNLSKAIEESGVTISCGKLPSIYGDYGQLIMLFQNLVGNAIKFRRGDSPSVHVDAEEDADGWVISVRDNGIGFEKQYAERIFTLFQRLHTRREYPGTGLGLALCKRLMERHGGKIWVDSTVEVGTTFFCQFPFPQNPSIP